MARLKGFKARVVVASVELGLGQERGERVILEPDGREALSSVRGLRASVLDGANVGVATHAGCVCECGRARGRDREEASRVRVARGRIERPQGGVDIVGAFSTLQKSLRGAGLRWGGVSLAQLRCLLADMWRDGCVYQEQAMASGTEHCDYTGRPDSCQAVVLEAGVGGSTLGSSLFFNKISQKDAGVSPAQVIITSKQQKKILSVMTPQTSKRKPSTTGSVKTGMTMTEKIFARASEKSKVSPGENVWVNVDVLMTHDVCGPGAIGVFNKEFGDDAKVWDREKVVLIPDHYIFTSDERANRNVDILRDFANEQNIKYFYDITDRGNFKANPDYKGVCHIALAQEGHCRPGEVLVGTDSHTCTAGAFGQFATGIGNTDAGFALGTGKLLLKVPPTLRFVLDGEMPDYLLAKDLILQIIGEISVSGATYKAMEFVGSTVESLSMEERMTLCNMVVEAGGKNGIVQADTTTFKYLEGKTSVSFEPVYSDTQARYLVEYRIDVTQLEPLVAKPHSPDNRGLARECKDVKLDRVYIGSCTGGKTEDFLAAAKVLLASLEVDEEEFLEINESIYFNQEGSRAFQEQFKPVIDRLKQQGYIGEEPLKHWKKNGELCKLDIINPDVTIEDKPLKHVTPAMEDLFRKHVDSLLKIGAIRPSKSRHRTMAMIVNSGTTVDPVTGREVKGKERMVFNYKSLNDNTYKDQYSLPGINTIIKRIGGAKIFSKFDLKSGFHQVAMDEESIPWTAFLVPGGLYEWLVMPFGLKNAPAVFQRKMDKCFKGTESFIAVYIDDILVFSKNEKDHAKHLEKMLKICEDNGLVLSPTKMKIAVSKVDFLGAVIGEGTIKLQPHIIKKIVNFNEEELKTKKGLRSFLGILNYARNHIPKLGILLRPLYEKTNAHGDKRLKPSDYELVRKIKEQVQNLPDLEIPPENAYIILETDGCMEGWGGIVKWKKSKEDPRSSERICAYASGKFSTTQSTIDAEINACINTLEKLKIYYLDKQEVTLRTDCQAIISFYNKTNSNKSSRVRWIKFADAVTGTGVKINIEHIEGKHNTLADSLSRLVNLCFAGCTGEMKELTAAALYSVEEALKSPNTSQKNMKITCEEVMKISNHFLESSQKLSSHLKNQEHYTNVTSSRPTKPQSEWINLMHGDQSLKTLNFKQQKKQLKPCDNYKQSYNTKLKSALGNQPKTTTGPIKEKMLEFKIKKPEESSSNLKPWHKDWDAITSNYSEENAINDDDNAINDDDNAINDERISRR
ncbi:Orf y [Tanacetum coccineum]|uniref:TPA: Orf y n=1 Tax=Tanacetum coccineum TaxID=301880 RepID=A0ABQ5AYV4_9ASTR